MQKCQLHGVQILHLPCKGRVAPIGVREGILLGVRKKFALKITICPKNKQYAPELTFLI